MDTAGQLIHGVLPYQELIKLCKVPAGQDPDDEGHGGLIRPARRKNVRSASYDLRLGSEYHMRDRAGGPELTTKTLMDGGGLTLEPNGVVVVRMREELHLDDDIVGHLTLKMDRLLQGLIIASQSQIDAGYKGQIFGLFYNLSDREITLKVDEPVLRLELVRIAQASAKPYSGDYKQTPLVKALERPLGSSLTDMRETVQAADDRIRRADDRIRNTRWAGAIAAVAAILIPLAFAYFGGFLDLRERTAKLEGQLEPSSRVAERQNQAITDLRCKIKRLDARPSDPKKVKC